MRKVIQVKSKLTGNWEYVFCYNKTLAHPITTKYRVKSLGVKDLQFFQNMFSNHEFRII